MPAKRGRTVDDLAREYGVSLNEFAEQVTELMAHLKEQDATASLPHRRREICAAVWAAMLASLQASELSEEERQKVMPLLLDVLLPFWKEHCAPAPDIAVMLNERSMHYLKGRDAKSHVRTAANIVSDLLEVIGAEESAKEKLAKSLIPVFSLRMLGDIQRINSVGTLLGLQLPLVATIYTWFELLGSPDHVLRVFKLIS